MNKSKKLVKFNILIIVFLSTILFSLIAFICARLGFHSDNLVEIRYDEKSDISYQVYLQPNDFFEQDFLPENMTYVASLIDYININYTYNMDLNDYINGTYNYYIKGIVNATTNNSTSNYYSKEYILKDVTTKKYENVDSITINDTIQIDYQTYNEVLVDFRNQYGISMEGNLEVILVVSNMVNDPVSGEAVSLEKELKLNIPLTTLTIEVPIEASNDNNTDVLLFSHSIKNANLIYSVLRILAILFYILAGILVLVLIYLSILSYKLESIYHKRLRKILKIYDGIIVNLKNKPNMTKNNILEVSTFEELIDAHSEVRNPINYIAEKDGALFLLMSENMIYLYKLKRELFSKESNK